MTNSLLMGYCGETNDINFKSGTIAFYCFLGFLINGESTNGAGLSESPALLSDRRKKRKKSR
ncbi:MAG: hypothetical protein WAJ93_04760 [Candidatus Nitrosopolaris sp.]